MGARHCQAEGRTTDVGARDAGGGTALTYHGCWECRRERLVKAFATALCVGMCIVVADVLPESQWAPLSAVESRGKDPEYEASIGVGVLDGLHGGEEASYCGGDPCDSSHDALGTGRCNVAMGGVATAAATSAPHWNDGREAMGAAACIGMP